MKQTLWVPMPRKEDVPPSVYHYHIHARASYLSTKMMNMLSQVDWVYTYKKGEKIITPAFIGQIVHCFDYQLYADTPGDLTPEPPKLDPSAVLYYDISHSYFVNDRSLYNLIVYRVENRFYRRGWMSPETRYTVMYCQKKPGKRITRPFLDHIMKPYGIMVGGVQ